MKQSYTVKTFTILVILYTNKVEGYVHQKRETNSQMGPSAEPGLDLPSKFRSVCESLLNELSHNPQICTDLGEKVVKKIDDSCHLVIEKSCHHLPKEEKCKKKLNRMICFDSPDKETKANNNSPDENNEHHSESVSLSTQLAHGITKACEATVQPIVDKINKAQEDNGSEHVCDTFIHALKVACKAGVSAVISGHPILYPLITFLPKYICSKE